MVLGLAVLVLGLEGVFDASEDACLMSLGGPKAAALGSTGGSLGGSLGAVLTFQAGLILGADPAEREAVMLMISSWKKISNEIFGITMNLGGRWIVACEVEENSAGGDGGRKGWLLIS